MDHADRLVPADVVAALPRLRRYARVLMGGRDGADELVKETLTSAWREQHARPPGMSLPGWLFGLMHAEHRRDLRNRADRPLRSLASTSKDNQATRRHAPPGDGGVAIADLGANVLRLPVEEREVLMLAAVERLSYAEIAMLLDMPVATVMSTLSRARARVCAMGPQAADSSRTR